MQNTLKVDSFRGAAFFPKIAKFSALFHYWHWNTKVEPTCDISRPKATTCLEKYWPLPCSHHNVVNGIRQVAFDRYKRTLVRETFQQMQKRESNLEPDHFLKVWSLSSFKVSGQLLTKDLNQVSSFSLLMTSSTALPNEGLLELTRCLLWHGPSRCHSRKLQRNQVVVRWKGQVLSNLF